MPSWDRRTSGLTNRTRRADAGPDEESRAAQRTAGPGAGRSRRGMLARRTRPSRRNRGRWHESARSSPRSLFPRPRCRERLGPGSGLKSGIGQAPKGYGRRKVGHMGSVGSPQGSVGSGIGSSGGSIGPPIIGLGPARTSLPCQRMGAIAATATARAGAKPEKGRRRSATASGRDGVDWRMMGPRLPVPAEGHPASHP